MLKTAPAVFAVNNNYQIMVQTRRTCPFSVKVNGKIYFTGCGYIFGKNETKVIFTDSKGRILQEHTYKPQAKSYTFRTR